MAKNKKSGVFQQKLIKIRKYDFNQKQNESEYQYYKRLAKAADKRMDRLEQYSKEEGFSTAKQWAYAKAMSDIKKWGTEKSRRFFTKPPQDHEKFLAKINDIRTFLESPTSTKEGIKNVYIKRVNTINERYGTQFTWDQFAKFVLSGQAALWDSKFGSKTALKAIARIQKTGTKEDIDAADQKDVRVRKSQIDKVVDKALDDNNLDIGMLF